MDEAILKFKIPVHKEVRIQAKYHMIDNWENEFAYMKVDGKTSKIMYYQSGKEKCMKILKNFK